MIPDNSAYVLSVKKFTSKSLISIVEDLRNMFPDKDASQIRAWKKSLKACQDVIVSANIPEDVQIILECPVPHAGNQIDLVLTGKNKKQENIVILVELKQWSDDNVIILDGKDMTSLKVRYEEYEDSIHPATQVYGYKQKLEMYNKEIPEKNIKLIPTVFLHNYISTDICDSEDFIDVKQVKMFLNKYESFINFLSETFEYGDNELDLVKSILSGKIQPSQKLAEAFISILDGNEEYSLDDNQLLIQKKLIAIVDHRRSLHLDKNLYYILQGGPGTGKSVIAINLLATFISKQLNAAYISKNAAPRDVYSSILNNSDNIKFNRNQLFVGPWIKDNLDVAIIDEAHRLLPDQVQHIYNKSKFCIFFTDDNQMVHCDDIGTSDEIIKKLPKEAYKNTFILSNQHRCNGSNNYLKYVDNCLKTKSTNEKINLRDYDYQIFYTIDEFHNAIKKKNTNNNARILAGFCWKWNSRNTKTEADIWDIKIGNHKWKWNLSKYESGNSNTWIIDKNSFGEVGCIHTSQGLEIDYCGVILGPDISIKNNILCTHPEKRASDDYSIKINSNDCKNKFDAIIKNTYRVLMTRGSKGCYIFSEDKEVLNYFDSYK